MRLGGGILRELLVDGDGFGVLVILLVQRRQFQQPVAVVRMARRGNEEGDRSQKTEVRTRESGNFGILILSSVF
jgi:hypothetical protein